ncbi:MAG TPA: serine hydrolase [Chitinophagaceae bacterium]|jgi:CubicO group peptidase (beta-lactamase class C family)|nr:serine hydrolase [Chitinophagaceae bacterium]
MKLLYRLCLLLALCSLSSCWLVRAYRVRKLELTDHRKLPSVPIAAAEHPFYFTPVADSVPYRELRASMDRLLTGSGTAAFLIIRNDSLIYERYFLGFNERSLLPANSMAKSFAGTLVGIALEEGALKSDGEPITRYLPELGRRDPRFHQITIRHLLDMRSGIDFNEGSYDLKDDAVRLGFRPNLVKGLLKAKIAEPPGRFRYQSINTQLLGLIVERATGQKLQDYLEEKLWKPMGAEAGATWNVDSRRHKHVITSAAINAVARDFAKLGRLYIRNGKQGDQQVISEEWVRTVRSIDTMERNGGYKNQWWSRNVTVNYRDSLGAATAHTSKRYARMQAGGEGYTVQFRTEAFNASGFLNQIIYVHPAKNLIIVRLGRPWPQRRQFLRVIYGLGESL